MVFLIQFQISDNITAESSELLDDTLVVAGSGVVKNVGVTAIVIADIHHHVALSEYQSPRTQIVLNEILVDIPALRILGNRALLCGVARHFKPETRINGVLRRRAIAAGNIRVAPTVRTFQHFKRLI
jgi:hypothetical protein